MHNVRIHQNRQEGVLWWAEGDLGFTGGSDTLAELVSCIREWAECEGVQGELRIPLMGEETRADALRVKVTGSSEVASRGVSAVRTRFAVIEPWRR